MTLHANKYVKQNTIHQNALKSMHVTDRNLELNTATFGQFAGTKRWKTPVSPIRLISKEKLPQITFL